MSDTKSPEALLQDALNTEQGRTKQLTTELGTEREAHTKTKNELADANKLVDELTEKLSEPAGPKAHTATLGSGASAQTYRFVVPQFYFEGNKVKAEEVKNNSDVLKALVKAGAKVIELVPAK